MKKNHRTQFFPLLLLWILSCAGMRPVTFDSIHRDLGLTVKRISENRALAYGLRDVRVGKTGFFYIVDSEGFVVFHPQAVLIGSNFGSLPFMESILKQRSGCMRYDLNAREYLVFFRPLGDRELLCLSIPAGEVAGPHDECAGG